MFFVCPSLTNLNISNFNTENVTDMSSMFYDCRRLTSIDLIGFNTENVTNMAYMFHDCRSLTYLDLSSFHTINVNDMQGMFYNCYQLTSLNLANFDMSHLTDHLYQEIGWCDTLPGKYGMCIQVASTSRYCTITCPASVQAELEHGTGLPTRNVTFTWLRPTSK